MEKLSQNYKYGEETKLMKLFKKKKGEERQNEKEEGWCATHANGLLFSPGLHPHHAWHQAFPSLKVWGILGAAIYVFVYIY